MHFEGAAAHRSEEQLLEPGASLRAWMIVFMLFGSMTINFIDRLVLANVAPSILSELRLSNTQYSYIVFGFMAGMTLGQLPAGMLADSLGARLALSMMLCGWSVTNMLNALARSVASFTSLRFIMGLFECGNYSAAVKIIGWVMPARQRAFALGIMESGSLLGSMLAPPLVVFILEHWGWHAAFFLPSVLGMLWLLAWFPVYPAALAPKSAAEMAGAHSAPVTVRNLLKRPQTWGLILMRAFGGPVSQFYWYWLPLYLVRARGTSLEAMAAFSSASYLIGGCGSLAGGLLSGRMIRSGISVNHARKVAYTIGALLAALSGLVPFVPGIYPCLALMAMSIFGLNFRSCNLHAISADIFPQSALARVTGLTGIGEGTLNTILMLATGVVIDRYSYGPVFACAGVIPLAGIAAMFILVGHIHKITFRQAE